jgi:hypothetical protein
VRNFLEKTLAHNREISRISKLLSLNKLCMTPRAISNSRTPVAIILKALNGEISRKECLEIVELYDDDLKVNQGRIF